MTKVDTLLSQPNEKTVEQRKEAAHAYEQFTKRFPVLFNRNMTRKMHVLSCVLPSDIRETGDYYKYLTQLSDRELLQPSHTEKAGMSVTRHGRSTYSWS